MVTRTHHPDHRTAVAPSTVWVSPCQPGCKAPSQADPGVVLVLVGDRSCRVCGDGGPDGPDVGADGVCSDCDARGVCDVCCDSPAEVAGMCSRCHDVERWFAW